MMGDPLGERLTSVLDLRALTFQAPMGQAVVARADLSRGGLADHPQCKTIENRPRSLPRSMLGQSTIVAVHCGLSWSEAYARTCCDLLGVNFIDNCRAVDESGGILGLLRLSGRQFTAPPPCGPAYTEVPSYPTELPANPWFSGPYGYEIAEAISFREAIPCRGGFHRGWWRVPTKVIAQVAFRVSALAPRWAQLDWLQIADSLAAEEA